MCKKGWLGVLCVFLFLTACKISAPQNSRDGISIPFKKDPGEMLVGIFIYDGVYNTEMIAPLDVFEHAGRVAEQWQVQPGFRVITIAPKLEEIRTAEGLRVFPNHGFTDAPPVDILVIPGGSRYEDDMRNLEWTRWIATESDGAKYTMTHAWGAFLLAASGRLEHKRVTTFPPQLERLKQLFPTVETVKDVRFVQDGTVITSMGGIASYEASLFLVKTQLGEKLAKSIAGGLVFAADNLMYAQPK